MARRQGVESPKSSAVTQTMKLLPISSQVYQNIDRNLQTKTKCLKDEKTQFAKYSIFFKQQVPVNHHLYAVEFA